MPSNAVQVAIALDRESTFQAGIANFDAPSGNGGLLYFTANSFENVKQGVIANRNYKTRAAGKHPQLLALKSASEGSCEMYQYGGSVNAAEGAAATRILRDEPMIGALGGEVLGRAAGIAGGTAALPTCDTTQLDSQATYSWGYFTDTSTGVRRFRKLSTITDGGVGNPDTINLLADHALPFTPDAGGADTMHAVVQHYPFWDAMEDHSHANHYTHTVFRRGKHTEDSKEPRGLKFGIGQLVVTAGERPSLVLPWKAANFPNHEGITQPALSGTPSGVPGKTVGAGTETILEFEALGTDLGTTPRNFYASITYTFGITYMPLMGPNGQEGVHGWAIEEGAFEGQTVEVVVPFDDDWWTGFRNETRYHMLLQVGTTPTNTWGVYCSRLSFASEPQEGAIDGIRTMTLSFEMLEDATIDISALAADAASRAKAKFEFLRSA